jgi:hypothetical protein
MAKIDKGKVAASKAKSGRRKLTAPPSEVGSLRPPEPDPKVLAELLKKIQKRAIEPRPSA